jgi:hypothetical protein
MKTQRNTGRRIRRVTAVAIATTFLTQNFVWAICSDGLSFPAGAQGYNFATLQSVAPSLANMSPRIFTAPAGSIFIPDNSVCENNNGTPTVPPGGPITRPCHTPTTTALNGSGIVGLPVAAVGGHNWAFDQGSAACKETDTGPADQPATGWTIPANSTADCLVLPVVRLLNGQIIFTSFGVVPLQGQAIVTTCDPTALPTVALTPNPANTRLNQLGCAISQVDTGTFTARDQTVAPAYIAAAGIKGGIFMQRLDNTPNNVVGDSGRVISQLIVFADTAGIPLTTPLTNAMVSPDGHFVAATSIRRDPHLYGCNMPLGDPGRIDSPPVPLAQFALSTNTITGVKCMSQIGLTTSTVTLSSIWGVDNQPYLGGQTAGTNWFSASAWPQCIVLNKGEPITLPAVYPPETSPSADRQSAQFGNYNAVAVLDAAIADVFKNHKQGSCQFVATAGFSSSVASLATYVASNGNMYMFAGGTGLPVVQARLTFDTVGATHYNTRTYFSGANGITTGIGVVPDMSFTGTGTVDTAGHPTPNPLATGSGSVVAMTDPSGLGLAAQEIMTRLPLCEDF